jgi:hypothetical protein
VVLALLAATRLPQLTSPHLGLDGDEAVVALMAKHFREGELPWFFWGQTYGFTFPEAAVGAAFFAALGDSTVAVKLAMLALWSVGLAFVVLGVRRAARPNGGDAAAAVAAVLFITCPAWMNWSMKARGGYLTSFVLAHLVIWWIAGIVHDGRATRARLAGIGAALALTWLGQPLWLPGLAPFVLLLRGRTPRRGAVVNAVAAAAAVLILIRPAGEGPAYWSPDLFDDPNPLAAVRRWPQLVAIHLSGMYYYDVPLSTGLAERTTSAVWIALTAAAMALPFAFGGSPVSRAAAAATGLSLLFPLLVTPGAQMYRYLLPVTGFATMSLAIELGTLVRTRGARRGVAGAVVSVAALAGLCAAPEFGRVSFATLPGSGLVPESVSTPALIAELDRRGIRHIYTLEPTLQWKIMFESGERIRARWSDSEDRVPAFPRAVDDALHAGDRIALIGRAAEVSLVTALLRRSGLADLEVFTVAGTHFVVVDPPAAFLRALGFELNDDDRLRDGGGS